jgi:aspartyl aminopeptidase
MADKEEAIALREEKKRRKKEATCDQFYDLTKKAIEVEESMAKAKAIEAEAKLMAEERDHVHGHHQHIGGAKGLDGEASCHHPTMRRVIKFNLWAFASNLCLTMEFVSFCLNLFIGSAQC